MNLIDYTYFSRDLFIAQRSQQEVREVIDLYIESRQPELLIKLLGNDLYQEFITGLGQDPVEQKWVELKSLLINEDLKISMIANYVFVSILEDETTENTGIGVVKTEGENSSKASPVYKIVKSWNRMIDMICEFDKKIRESDFDYPNYKFMNSGSPCPNRKYHVCGCRSEHTSFKYRNTLGL